MGFAGITAEADSLRPIKSAITPICWIKLVIISLVSLSIFDKASGFRLLNREILPFLFRVFDTLANTFGLAFSNLLLYSPTMNGLSIHVLNGRQSAHAPFPGITYRSIPTNWLVVCPIWDTHRHYLMTFGDTLLNRRLSFYCSTEGGLSSFKWCHRIITRSRKHFRYFASLLDCTPLRTVASNIRILMQGFSLSWVLLFGLQEVPVEKDDIRHRLCHALLDEITCDRCVIIQLG